MPAKAPNANTSACATASQPLPLTRTSASTAVVSPAANRTPRGSRGGSTGRAGAPDPSGADMKELLRCSTDAVGSGGPTEAAGDAAQIDCAASGQRPVHGSEGNRNVRSAGAAS